jgi:hypothetical protein
MSSNNNKSNEVLHERIFDYLHHFENREVSELPLSGLFKIVDEALTLKDQAHEAEVEEAVREERKRILNIVSDVDLNYSVNDGRDDKEMYGGQMAACEIRRRIKALTTHLLENKSI